MAAHEFNDGKSGKIVGTDPGESSTVFTEWRACGIDEVGVHRYRHYLCCNERP